MSHSTLSRGWSVPRRRPLLGKLKNIATPLGPPFARWHSAPRSWLLFSSNWGKKSERARWGRRGERNRGNCLDTRSSASCRVWSLFYKTPSPIWIHWTLDSRLNRMVVIHNTAANMKTPSRSISADERFSQRLISKDPMEMHLNLLWWKTCRGMCDHRVPKVKRKHVFPSASKFARATNTGGIVKAQLQFCVGVLRLCKHAFAHSWFVSTGSVFPSGGLGNTWCNEVILRFPVLGYGRLK